MTTREVAPDVEATLQMLAGLGRSSLEALAFEALQQAQKYAAAVALADAHLAVIDLSLDDGSDAPARRAAIVARIDAADRYREVKGA